MDDLAKRVERLESRINQLEALQKFDADVQEGMIRALEQDIEEVQAMVAEVFPDWPSPPSSPETE